MTTLVDHARSLLAYTIWGDQRILAAADGIAADEWQQVQNQFEHMLGTQRFWYGNWTGSAFVEPQLASVAAARDAYGASHAALRSFASGLTQEEWDRAEPWWKQWGYDAVMPLGESIAQLFYHGAQHRSEVAILLSMWGHSPGDMDYLTYLAELRGLPAD
jgi:uncharacterized damage-inducible protein DinB